MNLYTVIIVDEDGTKGEVRVRATNKIKAITKGVSDLTRGSWRAKDRIKEVHIIEDAGNKELTHEDYK